MKETFLLRIDSRKAMIHASWNLLGYPASNDGVTTMVDQGPHSFCGAFSWYGAYSQSENMSLRDAEKQVDCSRCKVGLRKEYIADEVAEFKIKLGYDELVAEFTAALENERIE